MSTARLKDLKDGSTLHVREARPDDAAALLDLVEVVSSETDITSFAPGEFGMTVAQERAFIERVAASPIQLFLLALVDGQLVGSLNFAGRDRSRIRHCGELGMSIRRSHWNLGIGQHLLETLFDWARDTGVIRRIELRVRTDNERAIALYEKCGFVREGTARADFLLDDTLYDHHLMARFIEA